MSGFNYRAAFLSLADELSSLAMVAGMHVSPSVLQSRVIELNAKSRALFAEAAADVHAEYLEAVAGICPPNPPRVHTGD